MDYDLNKELPKQKEKLWMILVDWFKGIRMYADIEMTNKNNDYLLSDLTDNKIVGNFLSLYNKHKLGFLTKKLCANDIREIRGNLLLSIMHDFCKVKKRIYKLEIIENKFSEFISYTKDFSKSLSIIFGKRILIEINSNQYEGVILLDNKKLKLEKNQKKYIDHAFFEIENYNVDSFPMVEGKREISVEKIGPTLKLGLDRKLIDYCRKKVSEKKIKDLKFFTNSEIEILRNKKGKVININNDLYRMKKNNEIYAITLISEVSNISDKKDNYNFDIFETEDVYKNTDIPKPINQEEEVLNKERNSEILDCKEKILHYMKTKMSISRRRILSLLASQQYGLKEISELLKMDYGKVRKERSYAKKELREAFPECYKIIGKKAKSL